MTTRSRFLRRARRHVRRMEAQGWTDVTPEFYAGELPHFIRQFHRGEEYESIRHHYPRRAEKAFWNLINKVVDGKKG